MKLLQHDGKITPWALAAKNIKLELRDKWPHVKFSVRSDSFSMGDSVSVHWELGPTTKQVDEILHKYVTSSFDGMQDLKTCFSTPFTEKHGGSDYVNGSREYPDSLREQVGRDLCALQHKEYSGPNMRELCGEMDRYYLTDHVYQLLSVTSFEIGEEYAGVKYRDENKTEHWAEIVKRGPAKPETNPVESVKGADMVKTKHTQKGYDLFVVRLGCRVSRDQFSAFLTEAKSLGGWWSGYDKDGAVPGFQFKKELCAMEFLKLLDGNQTLEKTVENTPAPESKLEAGQTKAAKFRAMAEKLTSQIEDKRRPMTQNPTPKRNCQYRSRLHDSDNLERVQQALIALANAHESGTVPAELAYINSKAQIEPLVYKGLEGGSYYEVIPSLHYRDNSPAGKALQALIENPNKKPDKDREIALLEQKISLSTIPGYFPTPPEVVERMLDFVKPVAGEIVLEPSAGSGAIACAVNHGAKVEACEINYTLRELLTLKGVNLIGNDFLELQPDHEFDCVIMNPPFERGQDITHIRKAYYHLKQGGRMAAICAASVDFRQDSKYTEFRDWIDEIGATIEPLPQNSFEKSGTNVNTRLILVSKP